VLNEKDVQPMLDQLGVPATLAGTTAKVLVDRVTRDQVPSAAPPISGRVIKLTMKTGAFPALAYGAVFTINTTQLIARYIRAIRDGEGTEVFCQVG